MSEKLGLKDFFIFVFFFFVGAVRLWLVQASYYSIVFMFDMSNELHLNWVDDFFKIAEYFLLLFDCILVFGHLNDVDVIILQSSQSGLLAAKFTDYW